MASVIPQTAKPPLKPSGGRGGAAPGDARPQPGPAGHRGAQTRPGLGLSSAPAGEGMGPAGAAEWVSGNAGGKPQHKGGPVRRYRSRHRPRGRHQSGDSSESLSAGRKPHSFTCKTLPIQFSAAGKRLSRRRLITPPAPAPWPEPAGTRALFPQALAQVLTSVRFAKQYS